MLRINDYEFVNLILLLSDVFVLILIMFFSLDFFRFFFSLSPLMRRLCVVVYLQAKQTDYYVQHSICHATTWPVNRENKKKEISGLLAFVFEYDVA